MSKENSFEKIDYFYIFIAIGIICFFFYMAVHKTHRVSDIPDHIKILAFDSVHQIK
nr:hypothetical protein [Mucilaginibacter sp. FT3.2]